MENQSCCWENMTLLAKEIKFVDVPSFQEIWLQDTLHPNENPPESGCRSWAATACSSPKTKLVEHSKTLNSRHQQLRKEIRLKRSKGPKMFNLALWKSVSKTYAPHL